MNKLDEARQTIDEIDQQMQELFIRRMRAVSKVLEYKVLNKLPVFDPKREQEIKEKKLMNITEFKDYYEYFIDSVMKISKQFQEDNYE